MLFFLKIFLGRLQWIPNAGWSSKIMSKEDQWRNPNIMDSQDFFARAFNLSSINGLARLLMRNLTFGGARWTIILFWSWGWNDLHFGVMALVFSGDQMVTSSSSSIDIFTSSGEKKAFKKFTKFEGQISVSSTSKFLFHLFPVMSNSYFFFSEMDHISLQSTGALSTLWSRRKMGKGASVKKCNSRKHTTYLQRRGQMRQLNCLLNSLEIYLFIKFTCVTHVFRKLQGQGHQSEAVGHGLWGRQLHVIGCVLVLQGHQLDVVGQLLVRVYVLPVLHIDVFVRMATRTYINFKLRQSSQAVFLMVF